MKGRGYVWWSYELRFIEISIEVMRTAIVEVVIASSLIERIIRNLSRPVAKNSFIVVHLVKMLLRWPCRLRWAADRTVSRYVGSAKAMAKTSRMQRFWYAVFHCCFSSK